MIRFLFLNLIIVLLTVIFCLWALLLSLFSKQEKIIHFYVAVPWAKAILWVCGINIKVKGLEHMQARTPRIYMSNHQSYFDIFALLAHIPSDFKFIMKQELMNIPLLGFAMRRAGYIGLERADPRKAIRSMKEAAEKVKNGASLVVFPEGTRSIDGSLQTFKKGGFNLALKSGVEIVPVAIINSCHIVPKGSLKINKGSIDINFGKPIPVDGYGKRNVNRLMTRVMEAVQREMNVNNMSLDPSVEA